MDSRFRGNDKEGEKCRKKRKKITEETEPKAKLPRKENVYFCVPSDGRWPVYSKSMMSLAAALVE
jgi:hypothetical protein